jgi:hypothetical protein
LKSNFAERRKFVTWIAEMILPDASSAPAHSVQTPVSCEFGKNATGLVSRKKTNPSRGE